MPRINFQVFYKENHINDFCLIPHHDSKEEIMFQSDDNEMNQDSSSVSTKEHENLKSNTKPVKMLKVTMDGYLCSLFYNVLKMSVPYRTCFNTYLHNKVNIFKDKPVSIDWVYIMINLVPPEQEVIDYKGNEMFEISCLERRELDNAMAWLSTLGGAFSALGDSIEKCANIAGKISLRQLQIALRLGDPFLIARCKLYMALSLIQRNRFKQAKEIVRTQFKFASDGPIIDHKLMSMCLGIWAKLKYDKKMMKDRIKNKQ